MLLLGSCLAGAGAAPIPAAGRPRHVAAEAAAALAAGDWDRAVELYGRLRQALPEAPEVPYNLGVAQYERGDLEAATRHFEEALALARERPLRTASLFNLGTTAYARALAAAQGQGDPQAAAAALETAADHLEKSMGWLRQAIDADPADGDARRNGELAWRMLEQLRQMQEPQQQGQGQQGEQGQEGEEQRGEPQEGQGQQQQGDQPQEGQAQQGDGQPQDERQQAPDQGAAGEAGEAGEPLDGAGAAAAEPEDGAQPREGAAREQPMSSDEARRLLQMVRDKEAQRRARLARQRAGRQAPVERDW
jgi:tetratricopeptide (TPR) repeat protein